MDSLYGQLLRRMPEAEDIRSCFAIVVPESASRAALDVPKRIRELLRVQVFLVNPSGEVSLAE